MTTHVRIPILLLSIIFLSAGCDFFGAGDTTTKKAGVLRTDNGGLDFVFSNKLEGDENGNIDGVSINKLQFAPDSTTVIYAATTSSGLLRSKNNGQNWKQILTAVTVKDFAVDPNDPKHIYASADSGSKTRLLETTNEGASWQEVFTQAASDDPIVGVKISKSNNGQVLLLLHSGVLVLSDDYGRSWKQVYNFKSSASRLSWESSGIYVLLAEKGLYRSTDSGNNFSEITKGLNPSGYSFAGIINLPAGKTVNSFYSFSVGALNPSVIYLTTDAGLLQTTSQGSKWKYLELPAKKDSGTSLGEVAISTANPNIVYVAQGVTMYKSNNNGDSWVVRTIPGSNAVSCILTHPNNADVAYLGLAVRNVTIF